MKPIVKPPTLPSPKVEIINLIDVLITLIAFFMFTTVFVVNQGQMRVQLPAASGSESVKGKDSIEISLTKENEIFLAERQIRPEELVAYLKDHCHTGELVMVQADRDCKYEWVISLLEKVKNSGMTRVGLRVRPKLSRGLSKQ